MIKIHDDVIQGSDEWLQMRCGLITASEVKLLLTPTLKRADNDKSRAHIWELAAQRISNYVEPTFVTDDMLRGHEEEFYARQLYSEKYAPVEEVGFVTNDGFGFTIGCSPDGLVGADGMVEIKSRRQKYQIQTIVEHWRDGTPPSDYLLQVQTAMLVTDRAWCDLISYSGGLPMIPMRIERDHKIGAAILEACEAAEAKISEIIEDFFAAVEARKLHPTERRIEQEMFA
ncbi:lambda exonuclease family protein [Novosphingobium sp. NPDC080210]|uniref:lambda exonuclease family protein n=1 Tax=Novosphingobium sp. NPDC080210 TaxID=3390596 RepID=UPI003D03049E